MQQQQQKKSADSAGPIKVQQISQTTTNFIREKKKKTRSLWH